MFTIGKVTMKFYIGKLLHKNHQSFTTLAITLKVQTVYTSLYRFLLKLFEASTRMTLHCCTLYHIQFRARVMRESKHT